MLDEEYNFGVGDYVLRRRIGEGASSSVWLADCKKTNYQCASKIVSKQILENQEVFNRFQREISLLQLCNHPFITQFYELYEDSKRYYVFLEYADNGDLETFLQTRGRLQENMSRYFFTEIILALDYLHNDLRIAHRDLKPQNILLDRYNNVRITDFGLSKSINEAQPNLTSNCGSPAYAAPEVIIGKPYNKAADIWSLGVILYRMVTGHLPFEEPDVKSILMKIVSYDPAYPPTLSASLIDLLRKMLCRNPSKRITVKEIMEHPWVVPEFISRVNNIVTDIRQNKLVTPCQPQRNPVNLQKIRDEIIFEISDKMDEARQFLPSNNHNSPPNSLPNRFPITLIARLPSNSILIREIEIHRPQVIKKSRSASNYPAKTRSPAMIESISME